MAYRKVSYPEQIWYLLKWLVKNKFRKDKKNDKG